ncbi:unnamed protein product [Timema podura]|uniref:Uncharacterized protein n=1 Tax=Timema podura TaxID=61482 RepID=A0ABN7NMW2_TIMPD|nr:unnamed protein product [Timema podura]
MKSLWEKLGWGKSVRVHLIGIKVRFPRRVSRLRPATGLVSIICYVASSFEATATGDQSARLASLHKHHRASNRNVAWYGNTWVYFVTLTQRLQSVMITHEILIDTRKWFAKEDAMKTHLMTWVATAIGCPLAIVSVCWTLLIYHYHRRQWHSTDFLLATIMIKDDERIAHFYPMN